MRAFGLLSYTGRIIPLLAGLLILFVEVDAVCHKAVLNGDEGFQFLKVESVRDGYSLYQGIWSDQPPFHHLLLRGLFSVAGVTVTGARLMAICFSALLLACYCRLMVRFESKLTVVVAMALFVSSYPFLDLAAAVLIGIPAYAFGLLSVVIYLHGLDHNSRFWLVLSGIAMGFGLLTKFSTLLLLPLIVMLAGPIQGWLLGRVQSTVESPANWIEYKGWRNAGLWLFGAGLAFVFVFLLEPNMLNGQLWFPHLSDQVRDAFSGSSNRMWATLADDWGLIALALYGVARMWEDRRLRMVILPIVWLVTSLTVHAWQRPFWAQYYFHLALPLSWLAAVGIVSGLERATCFVRETSVRRYWSLVDATVLAVCLGALVPRNLTQCEHALSRLSHGKMDPEWEVVNAMKEVKPRTKWVFSTEPMLAVQAGLRMPPELSVVSAKRFFSGNISMSKLAEILENYWPEQLLLQENRYEEIRQHFSKKYILHKRIGGYELLIRNDLIPIQQPVSKARELPTFGTGKDEPVVSSK